MSQNRFNLGKEATYSEAEVFLMSFVDAESKLDDTFGQKNISM